jgi:hypothetical protein
MLSLVGYLISETSQDASFADEEGCLYNDLMLAMFGCLTDILDRCLILEHGGVWGSLISETSQCFVRRWGRMFCITI